MNRPLSMILAVSAICASAAGCSSVGTSPGPAAGADRIPIYDSEPPRYRSYGLVKRLWVTSWSSAGVVPGFRSVEEGSADLRNQAAALGGDAVIHFNCTRLDPGVPPESSPKLICNGKIIKYQ
jgi:hypothetical protein